jgi:hypothetical protein
LSGAVDGLEVSLFTAARLVVTVMPATSISFFRPEFDDFLYAPVGADGVEMPLSVLSALARLDVDPWMEAAELSALPKGAAAQRLASLIARLPGGRWTLADSTAIADRLVELLPNPSSSAVPLGPKKAPVLREMTGSAIAKILFCAALGITAPIIAANRQSSSQGNLADAPAFSTASPPQTSPSSR